VQRAARRVRACDPVSRIPLKKRSDRRWLIPRLAPVILALAACKGGDSAPPAAPGPSAPAAPASAGELLDLGGSRGTFFGGDVARLRIDGADERVLVRSKDGAWIRAGEYDAWLGTYPVEITASDPTEARRQAVEQMIRFKLIVAKAQESGYGQRLAAGGGGSLDPKALAIAYIRDRMSDVAGVSDEEARVYEAAHPELFASLADPSIPPEIRAMAVKGSIRGDQLRAQVAVWKSQAGIEVEPGVFESH